MTTATTGQVREEAIAIARYLSGRTPPEEIIERYCTAVGYLFPPSGSADRTILPWAIRHPWALGSLDAACALLHPRDELRNRLLLMVALLETTPLYCDEFIPSRFHTFSFLLRLVLIAMETALGVMTGMAILAFLRMGKR